MSTQPVILCGKCFGIGLIKTERGSRPCDCQKEIQIKARLSRFTPPEKLAASVLEEFEPAAHTQKAFLFARKYVEEFIPGHTKRGLLFTGTVGTGKSHLAIAIAKQLIIDKAAEGRFADVREILDRLRSSYDNGAIETSADIMQPILKGDLVVIDDLGAPRPSEWVLETCELLISALYNRQIPVIVTTNYQNAAPMKIQGQYSLGDRIGIRSWSRLQEMCDVLDMVGADWRAKSR